MLIAFIMFTIAWNARETIQERSLVYLSIAYFFIAVLDMFHTMSYTGMNIFPGDHFYANQTWIATRILESLSLLGYTIYIQSKKKNISYNLVVIIYGAITAVILTSIFILKIFPECFIPGKGQTPFKIISEYVVISILCFVAYSVYKYRDDSISLEVKKLVIASILVTAVSEASFTLYTDNYGLTNLAGHLLKILSFYLLYKAIIETSIKKPYEIMFAELDNSNRQKDRLISIIGHDLTNAFSGIHLNLNLLTDPKQSFSNEELQEMYTVLESTADKTVDLLQNILLWAKSIQGVLPLLKELTDIDDLFELSLYHLDNKIKEKQLTVHHTKAYIKILIDYNMIMTAIRNLLTNSIKFTPTGGEIQLYCIQKEKNVEIHIKDNGVGMDEATKNNLFSIGSKNSRPGTNDEQGSGFGLLLVDEFVKRHDGTIEVISSEGNGSEFIIYLPI